MTAVCCEVSFEEVQPELGSIDDLQALCTKLREAGISFVFDLVPIMSLMIIHGRWQRMMAILYQDFSSFSMIVA